MVMAIEMSEDGQAEIPKKRDCVSRKSDSQSRFFGGKRMLLLDEILRRDAFVVHHSADGFGEHSAD